MKPSKKKIVIYVFLALLLLIIINWGDIKTGFIDGCNSTK